ncbi:phBC6A51 family helix-turn-helix protein [Clostridium tetani]|uniref:phBC6A51 family helix-turn-helix protein n=1 Tax=Clostridium tetani TaxID=1513 RepID=UPI00100BB1F5|nr:phBC6A51 family helix-turn-helix protein [Clostridium tetani]RXM70340.1 carbon monoxide dehydrogenase [Clostridium tetani]
MLNKEQMKAMELLLNGETITDTAKVVGVERKTIYRWMEKKEWKDNWNKCMHEIKTEGNNRIIKNLDKYVTELEKIALTAESDKTRADTLTYLVNRILGTPTNKTQDITEDKNKKDDFVDLDNIVEDIKKDDNVVELPKKKAK